jgi:hypothetical protein
MAAWRLTKTSSRRPALLRCWIGRRRALGDRAEGGRLLSQIPMTALRSHNGRLGGRKEPFLQHCSAESRWAQSLFTSGY